jgi:hypothetical protein
MAIRVEEIVRPKKTRTWLVILAMMAAAVATVPLGVWVLGIFLFVFALFGGVIINALMSRWMAAEAVHQAKERFRTFVGRDLPYCDVEGANARPKGITATAIAFDPASKTTFVLDQGRAAEIPWSDVRRWRWQIDGHSTFHTASASPVAAHTATVATMNSRADARLGSGFFLEVADVDFPEWQFQSVDKAKLNRWLEIFTQASEGRLPA